MMIAGQMRRHTDIGDRAGAADRVERDESGQQPASMQPAVAIGEEVVEQEIA